MNGPLSSIRVIEIGTLIAAPFAARLMAEFGAEVIKIEQPGSAIRCANGASCTRAPRSGGTCNRATRSRSPST